MYSMILLYAVDFAMVTRKEVFIVILTLIIVNGRLEKSEVTIEEYYKSFRLVQLLTYSSAKIQAFKVRQDREWTLVLP